MGVAALLWQNDGSIVCLGVAELSALRCDTLQLQLVLSDFVTSSGATRG